MYAVDVLASFRPVFSVWFCARAANQERDSRRRSSFAFVGGAVDRWAVKACAGSGHRLPAQARTGSHDGLLPQTRRARSEGAGLWWLGWRWSKSDWAYSGTLSLRGLADVRGDQRC